MIRSFPVLLIPSEISVLSVAGSAPDMRISAGLTLMPNGVPNCEFQEPESSSTVHLQKKPVISAAPITVDTVFSSFVEDKNTLAVFLLFHFRCSVVLVQK